VGDEKALESDQLKIKHCEKKLRDIAQEITQFESELMSPDCNLEDIKEREAQLMAKQAMLQEELIQLKSRPGQ
jgi:chromosome segregation ATPase